jgi:hypothetical protein
MADFTAADDEIEHRQNTMTPAAFFPSRRGNHRDAWSVMP